MLSVKIQCNEFIWPISYTEFFPKEIRLLYEWVFIGERGL